MTLNIAATLDAAHRQFVAGHLDEARRLLEEAVDQAPDHGEALEGLAHVAARQGDYARAADCAARLLQGRAEGAVSHEQYFWAAQLCQLAQRHGEAIGLFERCLARAPDHPALLHGLAMSLVQNGEHERALATLDRLSARHPQLHEAHYNRGKLLGTLGRYDDEMAAYRRAIAIKPNFTPACVNLGVALRDLHRFDEALAQFRQALAIDPNDVGARTNRAQTNLLLGEFEHGWREYEWRWRDGTATHGFPDATLWKGPKAQPPAGRTLFVHHEQGLGDTLQFVRYVDLLADAGARVVLRVQDALLPLLRDYPGTVAVIGEHDAVPAFDWHCPLLSLPFAFGTRAAGIPAKTPYLAADAARLPQWHDVMAAAGERPRVGIAWSGSRTHVNDVNRSMRVTQLAPLFDTPVCFVSLQKDVRDEDRACLAETPALLDVSHRLDTYADTAALVAQLDLVISVDTSVAHLAGALGKPVWIALPFTPDWRWQLGRTDSPWYGEARLFRQPARGDWASVVANLRAALDGFAPASEAREA